MSKNKNEKKGWWSRHAWVVSILLTLTVIIILACLKCCNFDEDIPGDPITDNGSVGTGGAGDLEVEPPAPHTHTWGEYVVTTPATCLNEGVLTATCTCGATTTKTVPANEHQPTTWTRKDNDTHVSMCQCGEYEFTADCEFIAAEVFYPDCEEEGYTIFCCTECENMYMGDIVPATGHVWGDWIDNGNGTHKRDCENCITTQTEDCYGGTADCENGAICTICNQEYVDPIGHAWGEWIDNGDGEHKRVCDNDASHVEYERHFDTGEKPGYCGACDALLCGHNGKIYYDHDEDTHWEYCGVCSTPVTEKFAHQYEETNRVEYCTEEGTITYTCVCGSTKTETIPAIDHDWSDWTDNGDGEHKRVCAHDSEHVEYNRHNGDETGYCIDCGILVCGHPYEKNATDFDESGHWTYCSICSNIVEEKSEHQYEEGKRVEYCDQEGEVKYSCACGYFYHATIPATGHAWGDWIDNGDGEHKRVCDNDASHIEYERHHDTGEKPGYCGTCDALLCGHNGKIHYDHDEDTHWEYCGVCSTPVTEKFAHQYEETSRVEYCTEEGTVTYTCVCGSTKTETIPATDHVWGDWTDNGDGEHKRVCDNDASHIEYERHHDTGEKPGYCGTCDALLCGHNGKIHYDHDEDTHWEYCGVCSTPVTEKFAHQYEETNRVEYCTEEGTVTYACVCGDSYSETIQPVGHDWGPWVTQSNKDSVKTCANDPTHTETIKVLSGNSVFVTTSTDMVFTIHRDAYDAYPGIYLEVSKPIYDENGKEISREVEIISEIYQLDDKKARYLYRNVMAKEMSVDINVKAFSGEGEYLGEFDYSIRTYAENMLRKDQPMELKTLLVDMLNYGAAAQKYFNYLTDDLANKNLTAEELAMGTQTTPVLTDNEVLTRSEEENSITLHGNAISLENSVKLNVHFELGKYSLEDINIVYTYLNDSGDAKRVVVDGTEATAIDTGYRYVFDNAGYSGVRSMVRISFEDKATGEQIGDSVVCSVESYLAQKYEESTDEDFRELLILIMKYGDSASAYAKYVGM